MVGHVIAIVALLFPAFCFAADSANQAPPPGALKFTKFTVRDPNINNVEACSMLIPEGWQPTGQVNWFPNLSVLANFDITITDPKTSAQIKVLPRQNFTWLNNPIVPMQPGTNYIGNIIYQPQDIQHFIPLMYGPKVLPELQQAKMITQQDLPAIAQQVQQSYGGMAQVKSARVRYEYNVHGKPWQDDVFLTLVYMPNQMGTFWGVYGAFTFRAPKGKLDELTPQMFASIRSFRMTPEWYGGYMYVEKLFNQRIANGIQDAKAISDTITRNSEEIRKDFDESYKQRNAVEDQTSKNFSQYIRGVDEYNDPVSGHPVDLPSGYDDAWVSGNGEYILSNDPSYNPNLGSTATWQRMNKPGQ